uniref:DUF192 domain-containing protein n=1 Tax=Magnetococcus massalia (strain MO-1) TaxID=451514 RepID=A0A1S7LEM1_MAGMO|nr:exported protein of unknown function [Candidatus Magnetococcus massalia]
MVSKVRMITLLVSLGGLFGALLAHAELPLHPTQVLSADGQVRWRGEVELVKTPEAIMRGLMYRHSLAEDRGMLFDMGTPRKQKFWMKNMNFSLDILFIDHVGRVITIHENVPPCMVEARDCPRYHSGLPAKAVLELTAGSARRLGITRGDLIDHERLWPARYWAMRPAPLQQPPKQRRMVKLRLPKQKKPPILAEAVPKRAVVVKRRPGAIKPLPAKPIGEPLPEVLNRVKRARHKPYQLIAESRRVHPLPRLRHRIAVPAPRRVTWMREQAIVASAVVELTPLLPSTPAPKLRHEAKWQSRRAGFSPRLRLTRGVSGRYGGGFDASLWPPPYQPYYLEKGWVFDWSNDTLGVDG